MTNDQISRRNLALRGADNIWLAGPVHDLDVADLRERLAALGRRPEARRASLLRRIDPMTGAHQEVAPEDWAEFVSSLVVELDGPEWDDAATLVAAGEREQVMPLQGRPFRLCVAPGWVTFRFSHALGDSTALWPAFMALTHAPTLFDTFPLQPPAGSRPLARAVRNRFGRRGSGLIGLLRSERAPMPYETAAVRDVAPRACATYATSAPGYRSALRAGGGGKALSALLVAKTHRAAADLGVALHPGVAMVVDCRRYLPTDDYLEGNFIAGSYLAFADPTDPAEIDDAVKNLVASGRPLLAMTLSTVGARRTPLVERVTVPDPQGRSLLSMSHVGRLEWPQGGHQPTIMTAMSRAVGDYGITVITIETGDRLIASVTWADGFQDPEAMRLLARAVVGQD